MQRKALGMSFKRVDSAATRCRPGTSVEHNSPSRETSTTSTPIRASALPLMDRNLVTHNSSCSCRDEDGMSNTGYIFWSLCFPKIDLGE